jgi:NAD(P)-dependent dehydrogenase (short-subunit alcohol dehydrogenase family)
MDSFQGKVAVVTGGASGIGRALAEAFAAQGAHLVLADIEAEPLARVERDLRAQGVEVLTVQTDVSRAEDVEALAAKSVNAFGAVHILCNNAGVAVGKTTWEHTVADWEWVLGVNLWGVIHGVHTFVPIMLAQDTEAHIVNTASVAGLLASGFKTSYDVTKFGVVALSESLYRELEAIGAKVKVSVLCPGLVKTRIMESGRNRPGHLENDAALEVAGHRSEALAYMQRLGQGIVTRGSPPSYVAEQVLQAIREERFYILPHDDFDDQIRERMEAILARENPPARP